MSQTLHSAMVLAAGYGKRMLPLTATVPKPLLTVGGRTMLDLVLDKLHVAGVTNIVVNAGYLGAQIIAHCAVRRDLPSLQISVEPEPLETGGGVKQALPQLGSEPFFVINADLPWTDGTTPALQLLRAAWNPVVMDMLLLTMPLALANGFSKGDFALQSDGRLRRHGVVEKPDVYIGAMIAKPELFVAVAAESFSSNILFDAAEAAGRLYGLQHDGTCYHVGTPNDLTRANQLLTDNLGWQVATV
ncbi:MAG: nucleotidyltransferase family protein [Alphaproteobacteria bacterium]|nr:nucleotidyltransferase family protein [Alphaproteobacteria bacterium]